jgi:hypothetical protein
MPRSSGAMEPKATREWSSMARGTYSQPTPSEKYRSCSFRGRPSTGTWTGAHLRIPACARPWLFRARIAGIPPVCRTPSRARRRCGGARCERTAPLGGGLQVCDVVLPPSVGCSGVRSSASSSLSRIAAAHAGNSALAPLSLPGRTAAMCRAGATDSSSPGSHARADAATGHDSKVRAMRGRPPEASVRGRGQDRPDRGGRWMPRSGRRDVTRMFRCDADGMPS